MSDQLTAAAPGLGWPLSAAAAADPGAAPAHGLGWPAPDPTPRTEEPA
jgi:hypothetical protein